MSRARYDQAENVRPLWLVTLADLSLLLVGFFVFLQSTQLDRHQLAAAIRQGFDAPEPGREAMPLDRAVLRGFATGGATLPDMARTLSWARGAAIDARTTITVTGSTAADPADRDPLTGSAPLLASDRARAVAAALVRAGVVSRDRIMLSTDPQAHGAHVLLSVGFAGNRQSVADRQLPSAAITGANP